MIQKIAVVGNAGGGKTTLSLRLAERYQLPLTHADAVQFDERNQLRPISQTLQTLTEIQSQESWIIDGYGPLDLIEKRFQAADRIVFIDLPLWRHYWWSTKRQLKSLMRGQLNWAYTVKLFKTILKVHKGMRPELLKIFARDGLSEKMIFIRNLKDWQRVSTEGLS